MILPGPTLTARVVFHEQIGEQYEDAGEGRCSPSGGAQFSVAVMRSPFRKTIGAECQKQLDSLLYHLRNELDELRTQFRERPVRNQQGLARIPPSRRVGAMVFDESVPR